MYSVTVDGATFSDYMPFTIEFTELAGARLYFAASTFGGSMSIVQLLHNGSFFQAHGHSFCVADLDEARQVVADINNPLVSRFRTGEIAERVVRGEPVGMEEIAQRLGVKRPTVDQWRARSVLPDPEPTTIGGRPWWRWDRIEAWARETGRLPKDS